MKQSIWLSLLLFPLSTCLFAAPWWSTDWRYRFHVKVQSNETEFIDKLVEIKIPFSEKFSQARAAGQRLFRPSLRLVETDSSGVFIAERVVQCDVDELIFLLRGVTPAHSVRHFDVYFNAEDHPTDPSLLKPLIKKSDVDNRWVFSAAGGYYVFEPRSGAFAVASPVPCRDNEAGRDWVRGDVNRQHGILNIHAPDAKAIFHPHDDPDVNDSLGKGVLSYVLNSGPLRYRLRSVNRFGEVTDHRRKTPYSIIFDIMPFCVRARMIQGNAYGFDCMMEVAPGGDGLDSSDYVTRSDGRSCRRRQTWTEDISPEWLLIGDEQCADKIYFAHAEDDTIPDILQWDENGETVKVGWGRGADAGMNKYPSTFYFGFSKNEPHDQIKKRIESLLAPVSVQIGQTEQVSEKKNWGRVQIYETDGDTEVVLENSKLRLRYGAVQTANKETALLELVNKASNENQAGKHLNEMASGKGRDRGALSKGVSVLIDNKQQKTVHLEWDEGRSIEEVTLYPDKPYVKIDYLSMYVNICDIGNPGGVKEGRYTLFGAEAWQAKRKKILADSSFKNSDNPHHRLTEDLYPVYPNPILDEWGGPVDQNPLNYHGWYIMGVFNPKNGRGYGRVVPAEAVNHLKLLFNNGFEQFPFWRQGDQKRPFSEYLFIVNKGEKEILSLGKEIADAANRETWYHADNTMRSIGNSFLTVSWDRGIPVERNYADGLASFLYRPANENFARLLDASGAGYAQYHTLDEETSFAIENGSDEYIEARVALKGCVNILKYYRLYRDLPLLEIRYDSLKILWWEDFYSLAKNDRRVYTIYGIDRPIDRALQDSIRRAAEKNCGHNFGDCFLTAAGSSIEQSTYKGFFIFGFHDPETGRGLGFVMPENVGLRGGFKLWSMNNYECFPFGKREKKLPLTRWIFVTTKGREGILAGGKALADLAAAGSGIAENTYKLLALF